MSASSPIRRSAVGCTDRSVGHVLIGIASAMLVGKIRQLVPVSLPDLSHIRILFRTASIVTRLIFYIASVEAHYCKATDDKRTRSEDDEKNDQGWGDGKAHVVPLLKMGDDGTHVIPSWKIHGGGVAGWTVVRWKFGMWWWWWHRTRTSRPAYLIEVAG